MNNATHTPAFDSEAAKTLCASMDTQDAKRFGITHLKPSKSMSILNMNPELADALEKANRLGFAQLAAECMSQAADYIAPYLMMPHVNPESLGINLGRALETFIQLAGRNRADALYGFKQAVGHMIAKNGVVISDLDIALHAYLKDGQRGSVTRDVRQARDWCNEMAKAGHTAKRINKGAYIVATIVEGK